MEGAGGEYEEEAEALEASRRALCLRARVARAATFKCSSGRVSERSRIEAYCWYEGKGEGGPVPPLAAESAVRMWRAQAQAVGDRSTATARARAETGRVPCVPQ